MKYVYDQVIRDDQYDLDYYGVNYELQQVTKRGSVKFYTYSHPRYGKMVVVPIFFEQYLEVCKVFNRIMKMKKEETILKTIAEKLDPDYTLEEAFGTKTIRIHYKDIRCTMEIREDGVISLNPEFRILSNEIFEEKVTVDLFEHEEFQKYYLDRQ